jgi:ketosteroid isomerase-like protein
MRQNVCTICGAKYDNETLVRTHIALSQAGDHANRSGFAAEDVVFVVDYKSGSLDTVKGRRNSKEADISERELPDNLSQTSAVVIKAVVNSNGVDDSH